MQKKESENKGTKEMDKNHIDDDDELNVLLTVEIF